LRISFGKFETGTISRRDFCEGVALAAIVYAAGGAEANAAPPSGLKMLGINHISYACPDYRKARDFYSSVLGMEKLKDDGKERVNLAFGPGARQGRLVHRRAQCARQCLPRRRERSSIMSATRSRIGTTHASTPH
jgi:hypothetical protein